MIDKKGRIFGKINIIDLVVILLVVGVLVAGGYKLLSSNTKGEAGNQVETGTVYVSFQMTCIMKESEQFVKVGDKLIVAGELTGMEIVDVAFEDTKQVDITDEGELVIADNPLYVDGRIRVKAEGTKTSQGIKVGGSFMRVNSSFDVATEYFSAGSKIVEVQFEPQE